MKTNSINQKKKLECHHINIEVLEKKPNACKNISPTFKYLTFIFQLSQILSLIQVRVSSFKKHDYNNLDFEVHANNS
jgi:hypothetical protein